MGTYLIRRENNDGSNDGEWTGTTTNGQWQFNFDGLGVVGQNTNFYIKYTDDNNCTGETIFTLSACPSSEYCSIENVTYNTLSPFREANPNKWKQNGNYDFSDLLTVTYDLVKYSDENKTREVSREGKEQKFTVMGLQPSKTEHQIGQTFTIKEGDCEYSITPTQRRYIIETGIDTPINNNYFTNYSGHIIVAPDAVGTNYKMSANFQIYDEGDEDRYYDFDQSEIDFEWESCRSSCGDAYIDGYLAYWKDFSVNYIDNSIEIDVQSISPKEEYEEGNCDNIIRTMLGRFLIYDNGDNVIAYRAIDFEQTYPG